MMHSISSVLPILLFSILSHSLASAETAATFPTNPLLNQAGRCLSQLSAVSGKSRLQFSLESYGTNPDGSVNYNKTCATNLFTYVAAPGDCSGRQTCIFIYRQNSQGQISGLRGEVRSGVKGNIAAQDSNGQQMNLTCHTGKGNDQEVRTTPLIVSNEKPPLVTVSKNDQIHDEQKVTFKDSYDETIFKQRISREVALRINSPENKLDGVPTTELDNCRNLLQPPSFGPGGHSAAQKNVSAKVPNSDQEEIERAIAKINDKLAGKPLTPTSPTTPGAVK